MRIYCFDQTLLIVYTVSILSFFLLQNPSFIQVSTPSQGSLHVSGDADLTYNSRDGPIGLQVISIP